MSETKDNGVITFPGAIKTTHEECLNDLKFTRDFDLYLEKLNALKDKYLIILCIRGPLDGNAPATTSEKLRSMGFSKYAAEPFKKYVGVSDNGNIICDSLSALNVPPLHFEAAIGNTSLRISFEKAGLEVKINEEDQAPINGELNIIVYDCKKSETVDFSFYVPFAKIPAFYHRNFYFSDEYINSHIYMPERHMGNITPSLIKSYFSNRKLNVTEVERGIFLPNTSSEGKTYGGICDEGFNFIAGFRVHNVHNSGDVHDNDRHIWGSYEVPPEEIEYIDETVLYGGSMMEHPGHLLVEGFPARMWWLVKNADSGIKIAVDIIWEQFFKKPEYAFFTKQYFEAFGIPEDRIIFVKKPTKFKKIIIPDQCLIPCYSEYPYEFTAEFAEVFRHINKQITPGKDKKIYLTKTQTIKKNFIGEEYFIDFFKARGFRIVNPEEYTVKEKAEIMYGAEEVVTTDGSNAHFSVFCKPGTRLTILSRCSNQWSATQQFITEAVGIKDFYLVNVSGSFFANNDFAAGVTLMCVTDDFKRYIRDVYGEELDITYEESIKNYICEYLAYIAEYYTDQLYFNRITNIKIWEILQGISDVFLGKDFDAAGLRLEDNEAILARQLKRQKEENARLNRSITQLEAEVDRLRKENSELSSYMSEISQLLDALEAGGSLPAE